MRRAFAMFVVVAAGCGPAQAIVTGEVTVDGQPIKKGQIVMTSGNRSDNAEIVDGRYEIRTLAGVKAVQISEDMGTDKKKEHNGPGAAWIDVPKGEGLPAKYNSASVLTLDAPPGPSTKDWAVSRK